MKRNIQRQARFASMDEHMAAEMVMDDDHNTGELLRVRFYHKQVPNTYISLYVNRINHEFNKTAFEYTLGYSIMLPQKVADLLWARCWFLFKDNNDESN